MKFDPYVHTMTSGDVGRVLGVTDERVRQLDAELQPIRLGRYRRYDPRVVRAVADRRERVRAAR